MSARHQRHQSEDSSDEEFSVSNYDQNLHPSAVQILTQIPGVTPAKIQQWLHTARLVSPVEEIYAQICQYIGNGQCHAFGLKLQNIIRLARVNQQPLSQGALQNKQKMLLWHGTKASSVPFILEHGLKLPPVRGQMFGSGIYFADRASKSANYSAKTKMSPKTGEIGYMFLCEVLTGNVYTARKPHNEYTAPPPTYDSVKCAGKSISDWDAKKYLTSKLILPNGRTVPNTRFTSYSVDFNEYIVYKEDRCRPDYLVKFEFTNGKVNY